MDGERRAGQFEPGNKLWQLRSKDGRERIFNDHNVMWDNACEYFKWCDDNPWIEEDWVGKDAKRVERKKTRPYTVGGLCVHLGVNSKYFSDFKGSLDLNNTSDNDFSEVITRIEEIIRTQKFEGAMVGHFNANIVARDLGLVDKKQTDSTGSLDLTMTKETIQEISQGLEDAH